MLDLRPHILKYQVTTGGGEDEDGNVIPPSSDFVGEIPCRAVLNGQASEVPFDDGSTFVYSHTIYLDLSTLEIREFKANDLVQVWDKRGKKILEKPIHGDPYIKQLHIKLFV